LEKNVTSGGDKRQRSSQIRHHQPGTRLAGGTDAVNIRFTSSLTPEDENVLAPGLIKALACILDMLPIAYVIRIDTSDSQVYQHTGAGPGHAASDATPEAVPVGGGGAVASFQAWNDASRRQFPTKVSR
jgi:hypothetical protein